MDKLKTWIEKMIPLYAILPVAISVGWNCVAYYGVRLLYGGRTFYDMTTSLENGIPVLPWTVFIYYMFFPFLAVNVILMARKEKRSLYGYALSDVIGKTVCLICFLILPTTNIRPEVNGTDLGSAVLRLLYTTDAANNLFPSIHCFDSWLCCVAVRRMKSVAKWYQILTLIIAAAICISTLTTKQHVIPDVVAGIALAEIAWPVASRIMKTKAFSKLL